ncbi:MAG: 4-hydroxythreonine-4-phosphate dehydrogenase PdxA [Bacteroidales bacterium]|nr:4-hydroxythreonine-4-phosphate dehydrogenase PdxA [Bacteroidales bacterium]
MIQKDTSTVGITMGDPSGIGPEIILKSFEKEKIRNSRIVVIGDFQIMMAAYKMLKITSYKLNRALNFNECIFSPGILNVLDLQLIDIDEFRPGSVQANSGLAAYKCIQKAVELVLNKDINAITTAPLNKEAMYLAGKKFPGHTELLASLSGARDYAMLLYDSKLRVIHVSTHISLLEAITSLNRKRIETVIRLADIFMKRILKDKPRIAVAGINPHAGEKGLFGNEEIKTIIPAVEHMKASGIGVEGPIPPDTVFLQAVEGKYDIVVAMYHDQGHIPLKLLGFNTGVNVTIGLPFIRTSVDHGTAFEIAWQGKANENSMVEAIILAHKLV